MPVRWRGRAYDLLAATLLATLAPWLLMRLEAGSFLRIVLAGMAIFAPGYLLMQAIEPLRRNPWRHAAFAVGLGPALVGLAALSTVLMPGGFLARNILLAQGLLALALGSVALQRRRRAHVSPATASSQVRPVPKA